MAERVGFVPGEPAPVNNLGPLSIPRITRNAQILSIRYKTGTHDDRSQRGLPHIPASPIVPPFAYRVDRADSDVTRNPTRLPTSKGLRSGREPGNTAGVYRDLTTELSGGSARTIG
jgi:hypothetical protein